MRGDVWRFHVTSIRFFKNLKNCFSVYSDCGVRGGHVDIICSVFAGKEVVTVQCLPGNQMVGCIATYLLWLFKGTFSLFSGMITVTVSTL